MLNDKAEVMILLKEATRLDCLARALDIVTYHARAGLPDWGRIREAIAVMVADVRHTRPATRIDPLRHGRHSVG